MNMNNNENNNFNNDTYNNESRANDTYPVSENNTSYSDNMNGNETGHSENANTNFTNNDNIGLENTLNTSAESTPNNADSHETQNAGYGVPQSQNYTQPQNRPADNNYGYQPGAGSGQPYNTYRQGMPGSGANNGYGYGQQNGGFQGQQNQWSGQNQQFHSHNMNNKPKAPKKPKKPMSKTGKVAAILSSCAVIGLACGVGGSFLGNAVINNTGSTTSTVYEGQRTSSVIDVKNIDTSKQMTPAEVYAANVNSTVGIRTSITTNYFGFQTTSAASGSGFIYSEDGYILTNYHVVEDASTIAVTTYDNQTYSATLVGYDESNDIAVLKIDATGLTPVTLGDSSNLNVGDEVVAIGNPLGELTFSLTEGVVSALDREVTLSSNVTMNLIQTDCAINSGNSGGALFNLYGEVIGITNAKYSSSSSSSEASIDNIGFAIPINSVKDIVESIIEKGYVTKPYLGVSVGDVSSESQAYGLPQGAAIASVVEGSPAEEAGLQENDIVTKVNDTEITSSSDLINYVSDNCTVGETLTLTVYRQGETKEIQVKVGESTQSALPESSSSDSSSGSSDQSGQNGYGYGYSDGSQDSQGSQGGQGYSGESGGSSAFPWFN